MQPDQGLSNVETYLQFTDVCGWTIDEWQHRTAELLAAAVLVAPPRPTVRE